MSGRVSLSRIGFLLTAFLLPSLIGVFASFTIPAPVIDAMHQEAALDQVLDAASPAAEAAALAGLGNAVDPDTAAIVTSGTGPLDRRIAAARANMRKEVVATARAAAFKIRLMVITMTVMGAIFGVTLLASNGKE